MNRIRYTAQVRWQYLQGLGNILWEDVCVNRDPVDCNSPGSSAHGISQARILEWVPIFFSRGSSQPGIKPGSLALQAVSLPSEPPGKPHGAVSPIVRIHESRNQRLEIEVSPFTVTPSDPPAKC